MKRILIIFLCLFWITPALFAQSDQNVTDEGDEIVSQENQPSSYEEEDGSYDMWKDPLYYQFEKMMPELARSLGRLDGRIATLAVTNLEFSPNLDKSFQRVARAKLYGQLLIENPKLKLIMCNECNMIRSEIRSGILTISRGLGSKEARQKLAEKLAVEGFMTAMVIEEARQLSVVVNVYDAREGRIVLSDVITGVPIPETVYYNIYIGQMTIPVLLKSGELLSQSAILVGAEKTMRFAESWMLAANVGLYTDNNAKLENAVTFTAGLMFDGSIGWEAISFMNNNTSLILIGGIGEFLSPQFNFSVYTKFGTKMIIGQLLTFNIYTYNLLSGKTNLEKPESGQEADQLTGSAMSVAFGFQF